MAILKVRLRHAKSSRNDCKNYSNLETNFMAIPIFRAAISAEGWLLTLRKLQMRPGISLDGTTNASRPTRMTLPEQV